MSLTMEFPFDIVQLIHEYDRPIMNPDLCRKYKEGAKIVGEWPMVEACLQTPRAKEVITLFEAMSKSKAAWDAADLEAMCITRRTHPIQKLRWLAEAEANDKVLTHRIRYNEELLALRILLIGEAAVKAQEAEMDAFHDACEHELDFE